MTERPIIFNGDMIRAILAGRKTQTRRPVKSQPPKGWNLWKSECEPQDGMFTWDFCGVGQPWDGCDCNATTLCPLGKPGDKLWCRETWRSNNTVCKATGKGPMVRYREGGAWSCGCNPMNKTPGGLWRPSIHMPRWASRITLEITGVRVERVQEISEADAKAEGCVCRSWESDAHDKQWTQDQYAGNVFSGLWDTIYAKRGFGWASNPWVWVVEFRRVTQ